MQATMVRYYLKQCPKCIGDLTTGDADDELRCVQCGKIIYATEPLDILTLESNRLDIWQADQSFLNYHRPMLILFQAGNSARDVTKLTKKNYDWVRQVLRRFNQIKEYRDVGF